MDNSYIEPIQNVVKMTGFFLPFIQSLLKKKIDEWKLNKELINLNFENHFESYLINFYKDLSNINLMILTGKPVELEAIFVPVSIKHQISSKVYPSEEISEIIFKSSNKIMIVDQAGSGKSTLIKWWNLLVLKKELGIPILIELKKLKKDYKIIDYISETLSLYDHQSSKAFVEKLIRRGDFFFSFDGYDEIGSHDREEIVADIENFLIIARNCCVIFTSRPMENLSFLKGFNTYTIEPLNHTQQEKLLMNLDALFDKSFSSKILNIISNEDWIKFSSNPLLLTLLYNTYYHNKEISKKRIIFYQDLYQALFRKHDITKSEFKREKYCELDENRFAGVLRYLARETFISDKNAWSNAELLGLISKAGKRLDPQLNLDPNKFLDDLIISVPLFIKDGSYYFWLHKSLQEFFYSQYVYHSEKKSSLYQKIHKAGSLKNWLLIEFLYESDKKVFRQTFIISLLREYLKYYDNAFMDFPDNFSYHLDRRKSISFYIGELIIFHQKFFIPNKKKFNHRHTRFGKRRGFTFSEDTLKEIESCLSQNEKLSKLEGYIIFNNNLLAVVRYNYRLALAQLLHDENKNLFLSFQKAKGPFYLAVKGKVIYDENKNNVLNSEYNFNILTDMISLYATNKKKSLSEYLLDYQAVKMEVESIENEIREDQRNSDED